MADTTDTATHENGEIQQSDRPRGTVTSDADLTAIAKIGKILAALDETDRSRVIRYIAEKYEQYLG